MTRVVVTGDFHGHLPVVPECDVLLLHGDCIPSSGSVLMFDEWLKKQPAKHIVGIAGNHDGWVERRPDLARALSWTFLLDDWAVVGGLKVWGSPFSMPFNNWAFMAPENELAEKWAAIPRDVDVLVTHGPAHGVLDQAGRGVHTGSLTLRERLTELHRLRLFAFGHIHEQYGMTHLPRHGPQDDELVDYVTCVNGSHMNEMYQPVNEPIVVEL